MSLPMPKGGQVQTASIATSDQEDTLKFKLSIEAGSLVAKLYDKLLALYHQETDQHRVQQSLNKLCVRLVFCWYADDAGLFGHNNSFHQYFQDIPAKYCRDALYGLFKVLDTPESLRMRDEWPERLAFPYVGGGLFQGCEQDLVPQFTPEVKDFIIKAGALFNWSEISPTIFGAVFESTLNPESRRQGGMHYTSVKNIHKVIDPLFLDQLHDELAHCLHIKAKAARIKALEAFQDKLAHLKFLDPACGSGNFLTESYISLRRLENQVIRERFAQQSFLGLEDLKPILVNIDQFYGIEINDFAVAVANTALWIAKNQMLEETKSIISHSHKLLPLDSSAHIVEANALTTSWDQVVDLKELSFIMGNPPFSGARFMTRANKQDLQQVLGADWPTNAGDIDFVGGWFKKAHDVMCHFPHIKTAFVATNSICQGTSVANLWEPLLTQGSEICFAHRSFVWDSEASSKAHVHCVIIGFANSKRHSNETKYLYEGELATPAQHINAYLLDSGDAFVYERKQPLCPDVPVGSMGNQPIDNGNYLFTPKSKAAFESQEPQAEPYFQRWFGGKEFLYGTERYCLFLGSCTETELENMPLVRKRVEAVRKYRQRSTRASTVKMAQEPTKFQTQNTPNTPYLVIPEVSSSERQYIPIGFMRPQDGLCSNKLKLFPQATLYHFSVLTSMVHMVWTNVVCGRLETRINYSTELVYNTFPWPQQVSSKLRQQMEAAVQEILKAREAHSELNLAQMYTLNKMPQDLVSAHQHNDLLVLQAYGFAPDWTSEQIFAALYRLYVQIGRDKMQAVKTKQAQSL